MFLISKMMDSTCVEIHNHHLRSGANVSGMREVNKMKKVLRKDRNTGRLDTYSVLRYCACQLCGCDCGDCRQGQATFAISSTDHTGSYDTKALIDGNPTY